MEYFIKHNIIDTPTFFYKGVRDDPNINVYECPKTNALVLDKKKQQDYKEKGLSYWNSLDIDNARMKTFDDDIRRSHQLDDVDYQTLLDFGCGNGGLLKILKDKNKDITTVGVELNSDLVNYLNKEGIPTYDTIQNIPHDSFDCIMLNHVFEHLDEPIETLKQIKQKMNQQTLLIIEVPHANDFLIRHYNCEAFKKFTFWSEHLILHTEESLLNLLNIVGFSKIKMTYYQRYNIFNHLHWLNKGEPGGHKKTPFNDNDLINSYNDFLIRNKMSDTLIAYCYI